MAGFHIIIDPDAAPLALSEENGFHVFSPVKCAAAQTEKQWASNIDTEGELPTAGKTANAEITPRMRMVGATEEAFRLMQIQLDQKIGKLQGEGGVLRFVYPDESFIDWEVRNVTGGERLLDNRFVHHLRTEDEITFVTAPFGEGTEELLDTFEFEGEAKRVLECLVDEVGGSAPALVRAVVTSPEADLWNLKWGRESRNYSEADTALSYYSAQDLTTLGGATKTTATVDGVASTPVVRQGTLTTTWQSMLSTQIEGVGHLTHEGTYEIFVWLHMPATNTGEVGVKLEYGVGDMVRRTPNGEVYYEADHGREGKVILQSLGQVVLRAANQGAHQWEGQVIVKSTVTGDDLDILDIGLRPVGEGNGEVLVSPALRSPASLMARDEFNQSEGNLDAKAIAASTNISGPKSPGTMVSAAEKGTGELAWANPANAKASDDSRATVALTPGAISEYLKATNFGFELPEGATPTTITVEVERSSQGIGSVSDEAIWLVKGGSVVEPITISSTETQWPTTDTYLLYEAAVTGWTALDIENSGFGVAVVARGRDAAVSARIDHIRITVYCAETGQKWATSGDATDIKVISASHLAQRTEVSDASIYTGRYAVAGTTVFSDVVVGIDCLREGSVVGAFEGILAGALGRYADNNNWVLGGFLREADESLELNYATVIKCAAGTKTVLARVPIEASPNWRTVWLHIDRRGRYFLWASLLTGGVARLLAAGEDSALATGGALASGMAGFYDANTSSTANTRQYDNFVVWIPSLDAVAYAGQSLEMRSDSVEREALGGGIWAEATALGDYLKLAPSGMEARKNRLAFIASPNDPSVMGVGAAKKLEVALYATPRFRTVPDPA